MPFDKTSHNYQIGYDAGAFAAFNHVLNYLNTLDTNLVDKTKIYKAVSDMRPQHLKSSNDSFQEDQRFTQERWDFFQGE